MTRAAATPAPDPLEGRLRDALRAEADRHPVAPDFEALRARSDRAVVDLRLPPRRNRARILAAAAVLALLAGTVGAIAAQDRGRDEPVATEAPPTGYYLPGEGWEVTSVVPVPALVPPGTHRIVELADLDPAAEDGATLSAYVSRLTEPAADLRVAAAWEDVDATHVVARGDGVEAREYVVSPLSTSEDGGEEAVDPDSIEAGGGMLLAQRDGLLLQVDWFGPLGEDAVVALADRWWTSGGQDISLEPGTGLARVGDVTYPDVEPVAIDELVRLLGSDAAVDPQSQAWFTEAPTQAIVEVEAPDGWSATYLLAPPGSVGVPTGYRADDGGASSGLAPDELGTPLAAAGGAPGEAWESATGIFASLPGADVLVSRTTYSVEAITAGQARELYAALVPASHAAWTQAVDDAPNAVIPGSAWAETLVATHIDQATSDALTEESAEGISGELPESAVQSVELLPRDGVNPAAGRPQDEVDRIVEETLRAFLDQPAPVDPDLFGPTTRFAYEGGSDPFVAAVEDVAAGPDWEADPITPATDAWGLLETLLGPDGPELLDEEGECPPFEDLAAAPDTVVLFTELGPGSQDPPCTDVGALVVTLDAAQQVTAIEARYVEAG